MRRWGWLVLWGLCFWAWGEDSSVPGDAQIEVLRESLRSIAADNDNHAKAIAALQQTLANPLPPERRIGQQDLNQARVELEQARLNVDNIKSRIANTTKRMDDAKAEASSLNSLLQKQLNPLGGTDKNPSETRAQMARNDAYVKLLGQELSLLGKAQQLSQSQLALLTKRYQRYNERFLELNDSPSDKPSDGHLQTSLLVTERDDLAKQLRSLNLSARQRLFDNIQIAIINKQILFRAFAEDVNAVQKRLQELQFVDFSSVSLTRIERELQELDSFSAHLKTTRTQLESNYSVIHYQYALFSNQKGDIPAHITRRYGQMNNSYLELKSNIDNNLINIALVRDKLNGEFTALSKHYLKTRFNFGGSITHLPQLVDKVGIALGTFAGQYLVSFHTFAKALGQLSWLHWLGITGIFFGVLAATICLIWWMNRMIQKYAQQTRNGFSSQLLLFACTLLKVTFPWLAFALLSWVLVGASGISAPGKDLLRLPGVLLLFIALPYDAMRILVDSKLMEEVTPRAVRWVGLGAAVGGLLFALGMMAQWILEDDVLIDMFRWQFSLFIALITLPLTRAIHRTIVFLNNYYAEFYTYRILRLIGRLIPLGFAQFSIASLLGYLNFAWASAQYALWLLLFALIWVALLAIFKDIALWAKRYSLVNTNKGTFWAQDVINPLHTLLRYASLFGLTILLLHIYDWNTRTPGISDALAIINKPIFSNNHESQFTLMNIILMVVLIYVVFRFGNWLKSFSYRWIYSKVADLGIRNSLAVFTQYAAVTLGFLLTLRVIGIDLTAFTVFAGAIGVGIGFGMQTIANNFISGILLLIERPLRNGDTITVGGYDGTVERIGMRSLTITTFDNESVILPNSEFITSSFKNWSHNDQLKRMVIYFDISYRHDPDEVEAVLNATLKELLAAGEICEVLPDLVNRAFAYNCSPAGITYRIQYYFHLLDHEFAHSRQCVISSIWHACQAHGFELAYPKYDLYFPEHTDQEAHRIHSPRKDFWGRT